MIGPHQGKELELMLKRQKYLAIFCDALTDDGISETIIPEQAFLPYIKQGAIIRFSRDYKSNEHVVRYVCFTLPGHEWRADAFFWIHEECVAKRRPFDEAYEFFIGRLLDYEESDIQHFIQRRKEKVPARTGT